MTKKQMIEYVKSLGGIETTKGWNVPNDVDLLNKNLIEIPIQFNIVNGYFLCSINQLTSLKGCPKVVGGNFYCHNNQLTSLKYSPKIVRGDFYCYGNQLTSLKDCPKEVKGYFSCFINQITSFKYAPKIIGKDFYCDKGHFQGKEYYDFLLKEKTITEAEYLLAII